MTTKSILAAVAAGCLASACANVQGTERKPVRPVKVQAVSEAPAPDGVRYSAAIEPYEQVSLAFKASGYVDSMLRRAGVDGRLRTAQPGDLDRPRHRARQGPRERISRARQSGRRADRRSGSERGKGAARSGARANAVRGGEPDQAGPRRGAGGLRLGSGEAARRPRGAGARGHGAPRQRVGGPVERRAARAAGSRSARSSPRAPSASSSATSAPSRRASGFPTG